MSARGKRSGKNNRIMGSLRALRYLRQTITVGQIQLLRPGSEMNTETGGRRGKHD